MEYIFLRSKVALMPKRAANYRKKEDVGERLVPRGAPPELGVVAGESTIDLDSWADQLVQLMLRQNAITSHFDDARCSDDSDPTDNEYPEAG